MPHLRLTWQLFAVLALPGLAANSAPVPGTPDQTADIIVIRNCETEYLQFSRLGSPEYGILQDCYVREGMRVQKGHILARLPDRDLQVEVARLKMLADNEIDIRVSEAKLATAQTKLQRSEALRTKNVVSEEEYNLDKLSAVTAGLEVEQAKLNKRLNQVMYQQARARLSMKTIVAPHDGVIVNVAKKKGDGVVSGEAIVHLANNETLLITGQLDVTDVWRVRQGQTVRIIPDIGGADLEIEKQAFEGKLVFVDNRIDPASQTCKVVAEVDNRQGQLKAGIKSRMEIIPSSLAQTEEPAAAPPSPILRPRAPQPAPAGGDVPRISRALEHPGAF